MNDSITHWEILAVLDIFLTTPPQLICHQVLPLVPSDLLNPFLRCTALVQGTILPHPLSLPPSLSESAAPASWALPCIHLFPFNLFAILRPEKVSQLHFENINFVLKTSQHLSDKDRVLSWFTHCVGLSLHASPPFCCCPPLCLHSLYTGSSQVLLSGVFSDHLLPKPKLNSLPACCFSAGFFSFAGHPGMWSHFLMCECGLLG